MRYYLKDFLFAGERGASLEALGRGVGEDQAWINRQ